MRTRVGVGVAPRIGTGPATTDGIAGRITRGLLSVTVASLSIAGLALPAAAGAYATAAPESRYSTASGLPDGRVYEQATPPDKFGNEVTEYLNNAWGYVSADGNGVLYYSRGPIAPESASGNPGSIFISQHTANGWVSRSAVPRGAPGIHEPEENNGLFAATTQWFLPATDLSRIAFSTANAADVGPPDEKGLANNFYLIGSNPFVEPIWIARSRVENAPPEPAPFGGPSTIPTGGSPDLSTIYFEYPNTSLLPMAEGQTASGYDEWHEGVLSDAGALPGGANSPAGAIPAAQLTPVITPAEFDNNQVSRDGLRAFFARSATIGGPSQLYVHITASDGTQSSALISESQLSGHVGEPAPDGVLEVPSTLFHSGQQSPPWYVFASADGNHAFFQSVDRLTSDAPEDVTPKTYDYDLDTGHMEYLPGVTGSIVAVSEDGSSMEFENTATTPDELDRWSAGANGGTITPIAQLPAVPNSACIIVCVGPVQTSTDGSVVVFQTESTIAGFNDKGNFVQVFRYDAKTDELACASCPPAGIAPSFHAVMSNLNFGLNNLELSGAIQVATDERAISTDGSRIFFDTQDALVPQDVNGEIDTYEWENGSVFLISGGTSTFRSWFLGTGESGGDAYFTSNLGLVPGDNDGSRDVYDARIPRPGDNPPPAAVPCQGDVCQGQPSVPQLLGAPPSATFNGAGNVVPQNELIATVKGRSKHKPKRPNRRKKHKKAPRSHRITKKSRRRGK